MYFPQVRGFLKLVSVLLRFTGCCGFHSCSRSYNVSSWRLSVLKQCSEAEIRALSTVFQKCVQLWISNKNSKVDEAVHAIDVWGQKQLGKYKKRVIFIWGWKSSSFCPVTRFPSLVLFRANANGKVKCELIFKQLLCSQIRFGKDTTGFHPKDLGNFQACQWYVTSIRSKRFLSTAGEYRGFWSAFSYAKKVCDKNASPHFKLTMCRWREPLFNPHTEQGLNA